MSSASDSHAREPRGLPSRRALLLAGAAFAGGAAIGGVAGLALQERPDRTDDVLVGWVRRVARQPDGAPLLRRHYHGVLYALSLLPDDPELWSALRSVVGEVEQGPRDQDARLVAASFRQLLTTTPTRWPDHGELLARLRAVEEREEGR